MGGFFLRVSAGLSLLVLLINFSEAAVVKKNCCIRLVNADDNCRGLAKIIGFDLDFSGWLHVGIEHAKPGEDQKQLYKRLFDAGTDWCVYITPVSGAAKGKQRLQVSVVQTWSGTRLFNKRIDYELSAMVRHGHQISSLLLNCLVGKKGLCSSTMAWCQGDFVYCSDYTCRLPRKVVSSAGSKFALSFHSKVPLLFYTQVTERNGELCAVDLVTGKQRVLFSYPGLTMQFSMSPDGCKGVTCMSGGNENTELYLYDQAKCNQLKRKVFVPLTQNGGTNASPCYLPNGDLVFCSDFQTGKNGRPQIYYLDVKRKKSLRLTDGLGFCAAPNYCAANNSVVFNKSVNGVFQVFKLCLDQFDKKRFKEGCGLDITQLTTGAGDKTEPQWHETGDYIVFVLEKNEKRPARDLRFAILNLVDGTTRLLPVHGDSCGFPAWTIRELF